MNFRALHVQIVSVLTVPMLTVQCGPSEHVRTCVSVRLLVNSMRMWSHLSSLFRVSRSRNVWIAVHDHAYIYSRVAEQNGVEKREICIQCDSMKMLVVAIFGHESLTHPNFANICSLSRPVMQLITTDYSRAL
jgi:hypothetical protein